MEAHRRGLRKAPRERAEPGEGLRRTALVEASDRRGDLRVGVAWGEPGGGVVLPPGGDPVAEPLEGEAVEQLRVGILPAGVSLERCELGRRREAGEPGRWPEARHEERLAGREVRMERGVGTLRRGGVGLRSLGPPPGSGRLVCLPSPEVRVPEMQEHERVARPLLGELLDRLQARVGPPGDRGSDLRLGRVVALEDPPGRGAALLVE